MTVRARELVQDGTLAYDHKLRRLATLATEVLPRPAVSDACEAALDKRVICDMFEGHAPYTARYILPDYELAIRQGLDYLEMPPPTDLDDALAFLQVMYAHVPSVTTYPVYLGDLDKVLAPFVTDEITDQELDTKLRRFWIGIDRMLPDAFVHLDVGPHDSRITRSIFRVERALRQAVRHRCFAAILADLAVTRLHLRGLNRNAVEVERPQIRCRTTAEQCPRQVGALIHPDF